MRSLGQQAEFAFWNAVKDSKHPAYIQNYLDKYPTGTFATLAKALISRLNAYTPTPRKPGAAADPERTTLQETQLVERIQRRLSALKCYTGRIDGKWGRNTIRAINRINQKRARGSRLASAQPEPTTQQRLQAIRKPVCQVLAKLPAKVEPGGPKAKAKKKHGRCPGSALAASRPMFGTMQTGGSLTGRHRCGRRLTCVGGSSRNNQPRRCRWL